MKTPFHAVLLIALMLSLPISATSAPPSPPASAALAADTGELLLRATLARQIVHSVRRDAESKGATGWELPLLTLLYRTQSSKLQQLSVTVATLDDAIRAITADPVGANTASRAGHVKALAGVPADLVFTPITPCRYIDTRNFGGGITIPRDFSLYKSGAYYGGSGGCQLPTDFYISAVAINATIVVPVGAPGYLGLRPLGDSSVTSFINWVDSGTSGTANAGIVATGYDVNDGYAPYIEAFKGGANSPQLIVDVFGYFTSHSSPACSLSYGTALSIAPGNSDTAYSPYCPTPTLASGSGACYAYHYSTYLVGTFDGTSPTGPYLHACTYYNNGSEAHLVSSGIECCTIP